MTAYVAFLRGINVGGRVMRMADLKSCFEAAGMREVRTVLQSGNVIFQARQNAAKVKTVLETALSDTFHYPAKVQVIELSALQKIIEKYPFGRAGSGQHDYVIFMEHDLEKDVVAECYDLTTGEQVAVGHGVIYWCVDKGSTLKSSFAKQLTRGKYKQYNTNRNLKTLQIILA